MSNNLLMYELGIHLLLCLAPDFSGAFFILWYNIVGVFMIIIFKCTNSKCNTVKKKFYRKAKDINAFIDCDKCTGLMERQLAAPNTKSTTIIDNGKQQRQVEVDNEIVEQERDKVIKEG